MLKPFMVTTAHSRFIIYASRADDIQNWYHQPLMRIRACWIWLDVLLRLMQQFLIPKRVLKYEYIHLLEIIGQPSGTHGHLTEHLNRLLEEKHSRLFRYQICEFIRNLNKGLPLPKAFSLSFNTLSEYVQLLKNPELQEKLPQIIPYIIKGIDSHLSCKLKITTMLVLGFISLWLFTISAYYLCHTVFMREAYRLRFNYISIHPIAQSFMNIFQQLNPMLFNRLAVYLGAILISLQLGQKISMVKYLQDHILLRCPFIGKIILSRMTERMLYTLSLCHQCHLDYTISERLCREQISNQACLNIWNKLVKSIPHQYEMTAIINAFIAPISFKLTSTTKEHLAMTMSLVQEEVIRRQRNLEWLVFFIIISCIIALVSWMLLTYASLKNVLYIYL